MSCWPTRPRLARGPPSSSGPCPMPRCPSSSSGRAGAALADAATWWFGDPSHELGVVGITGTDGKTTTAFLAVAALEAAGISTGLLGTVDTKIGDAREPNKEHVTTPGAVDVERALRAMVAEGNAAAVVETTSHGLAADRVTGDRLRRRDPHEPHPRAPRVPSDVGGLPRREALPVRAAGSRRSQPIERRAGLAEERRSSTSTIRRPVPSSALPRRPAPGS